MEGGCGEDRRGVAYGGEPVTSDIAVVILNHNGGTDVLDCLRSVVAEHPAEVVVVDNGSEDGSAERIAELSGVRLLRNERNLGFAAPANQGARASHGPYILFLNSDAILVSGALEVLHASLDAHPRAAVIGALVRNPDGTVQPTRRAFPSFGQAALHGIVGIFRPNNRGTRAYILADEVFDEASKIDWVAATAMAVRREAFDAVGGFDEAFWFFVEDIDLCKRLTDAGYEVWFEPGAEVVHRWGGAWTKRPLRFIWMHNRNLFRYVRKHNRGAWVLAYPFIAAGLLVRFVLLTIRWLITRRSVPGHRSLGGAD
jgi:N-acetylglucosaminyl-diphospho-decaprenol L-rhamnosyltransferase